MKRVLYITNIQVPYRVRFFNELSKKCDLTVLYERSQSGNRNNDWSNSIECNFKQYFLDGIKIGNESSFSFKVLKYITGKKFDDIILGCYSTPVQIFANVIMRITSQKFIMNFDGEVFANDKSLKTKIKKLVIRGADSYLIAGEKAAENLRKIVGDKKVTPYYFSSLSDDEIIRNSLMADSQREDFILVVGQYFDYKGLDVPVKVARETPNQKFKFVGMGKRTNLFIEECCTSELKNVEVIPFMQKDELFEEYRKCKCLLLPTKQECWGLVINEAASFGTPIISTYGSGAAVEFLEDNYSCLLATPGDVNLLRKCIAELDSIDIAQYSNYLKTKSTLYSIEKSVRMTLLAIGD